MAPTARDVTDPQLNTYTPVPVAGPGVCNICHGAPNEDYARCYSCFEAMRGVTHPLNLVVPISLTRVDEQLHHVLRGYKTSFDARTRRDFAIQIAAMMALFLHSHESCIESAAGRSWDTIATVPSTRGRTGPHPLLEVVGMVRALRSKHVDLLAPGTVPIGHNASDDHGFAASPEAAGRSILLVDDTFTSGARIQSAASALRLAGAKVVAALLVGRVIDPERSAESKELWGKARKTHFTFDHCCLRDHSSVS